MLRILLMSEVVCCEATFSEVMGPAIVLRQPWGCAPVRHGGAIATYEGISIDQLC
jgi:hypothetical protein